MRAPLLIVPCYSRSSFSFSSSQLSLALNLDLDLDPDLAAQHLTTATSLLCHLHNAIPMPLEQTKSIHLSRARGARAARATQTSRNSNTTKLLASSSNPSQSSASAFLIGLWPPKPLSYNNTTTTSNSSSQPPRPTINHSAQLVSMHYASPFALAI